MNDLVRTSYDITEITEKYKLCQSLAKSSLIPKELQGKPEDVFIVLQSGYELSLPPMQSLSSIYVVQGKPTSSGQLMLALIRRDCPGAVVKIDTNIENKTVTCTMARSKDDSKYSSSWDMSRAREMGLTGKDNWKKQPLTMLKWRAVADAARTVFPDVIKGLYITDEVVFDDRRESIRKDKGVTENTANLTNQLLEARPE